MAYVRQGCPIAPFLFLPPTDWILQRTVHKGFLGATLGSEVFTDLDYADDVALLAEMLEVLLLTLEVMNQEARPFGLEINWDKTKIQTTVDPSPANPQQILIAGNPVQLVDKFTYLGSQLDRSSVSEVLRRIAIAREWMKSLDHNIWRSSISHSTKFCLYMAYILPVLLYSSETWTMTKVFETED